MRSGDLFDLEVTIYVEISTYYSQIHNIIPLCLSSTMGSKNTVHSFTTKTEIKAWATICIVINNQFLDSFNKLSDRRTGVLASVKLANLSMTVSL